MSSKKRFDFVTCLVSVLAGLLWAYVGGMMLRSWLYTLWTPLLIGLYYLGLALILILTLRLCTLIKKRVMPEPGSYQKAFALSLSVLILAGLFQWVYSRDFHTEEVPVGDSAYIFLVDESGSMFYNDPYNDRAKAIQNMMADCDPDFPYAVYGFNHKFRQVSPISPASEAADNPLVLKADGETDIPDAIEYVLQEMETGKLDPGARPHIILVTDGYATSSRSPLASALDHANRAGARVSTVGVGPGVDVEYLRNIAVKTEGNYVTCENMSELLGSFIDVTEQETTIYNRTLLNTRPEMPRDWLYAAMRVAFLLVLAVPFLIIKALLLRTNDANANVLIPNLLLLVIGALSVEIGMNRLLYMKEIVVQSILCVGFAILIVTELKKSEEPTDDDPWGGQGSFGPEVSKSGGAGKKGSSSSASSFDDWD